MHCFSRFAVTMASAVVLLLNEPTSATLVVSLDVMEAATGSGTFVVSVSGTANDPNNGANAGVASYRIPLLNDVITVDHNSPNTVAAENAIGIGPIAFAGFGRSADGVATLDGSQNTIDAAGMVVYDMGTVGGDAFANASPTATAVFTPWEQQNYAAPLQVASGTWAGTAPALGGISINLFDPIRDKSTFKATTIQPVVTFTAVPEPAAFLMLSVVGLVVARNKLWGLVPSTLWLGICRKRSD